MKNIKVKARDIIIIIIVLLIFLLFLKQCRSNDEKLYSEMKGAKIEDSCNLEKDNVNALNELLSRADLCSEKWFEDFDDYISGIAEQNELLSEMKGNGHKSILEAQDKLLNTLKSFRDDQSDISVNNIEEALENYMNLYEKNCK